MPSSKMQKRAGNHKKVAPYNLNKKRDFATTESLMKQFAEATREFCLQSTLHGPANLLQKGTKLLKFVWLIVIFTAMGWFMYEAGKVVQKFCDSPTMTKISAEPAKSTPELRLCPFFFIDPKRMQANGLTNDTIEYGLDRLYDRSKEALQRSYANEASDETNVTSEMSSFSATQAFLANVARILKNKSAERFTEHSQQLEKEQEILWNRFLSGRMLGDGFRALSYNFTEFAYSKLPDWYNETYKKVELDENGLCYILKEHVIDRKSNDYISKVVLAFWLMKNKLYQDTKGTNAVRIQVGADRTSTLKLAAGSSYQIYFTAQRRIFVKVPGCIFYAEKRKRQILCFQLRLKPLFPTCRCFISERFDLEDRDKNITSYCSAIQMYSLYQYHSDIQKQFDKCSASVSEHFPLCEKWEYNANISPIKTADIVPATETILQRIEMAIQVIFVNSEAVLTVTEMHSFTYDQAMSAVGGLLGLFMGGSIISILHILYFCITRLVQPD